MKEMGDIDKAEAMLLAELKELFLPLRKAAKIEPSSLEIGLEAIKTLRYLVYENMNQLQHEGLILKAAKLLEAEFYQSAAVKWLWNPRQTGNNEEPDLRGLDSQGKVIISAEATTSLKPQGGIDKRMTQTLAKLSAMPGDKYYVVTTEEMENRAKSKVHNLGYKINILRI